MSNDLSILKSEMDDPTAVAMAANMVAQGIAPTEPAPVDYFAQGADVVTMLPDGVSWISHKKLNEGDRKRYLQSINKDLKIQKGTGDAIMKLAAGEDRSALLAVAITGWNLTRGGVQWPFNQQNLRALLDGPVQILELVEKDVKKNNSWLFNDDTVEDIDKEIERLQSMKDAILERDAKK